jgi:hypothetical protein
MQVIAMQLSSARGGIASLGANVADIRIKDMSSTPRNTGALEPVTRMVVAYASSYAFCIRNPIGERKRRVLKQA